MNKIYQKRTLTKKRPAKGKIGGFTLIELLVVVLIIGILSAIALPEYTKAVEKSRSSEAITLLRSLLTAEKAYKLANMEYTSDLTLLDLQMPNINMENSKVFSTDDWYIYIPKADSALNVYAARAKNGVSINSGKNAYGILLSVDADGNETWKCQRLQLDSTVPDICKSITGSADGIIK